MPGMPHTGRNMAGYKVYRRITVVNHQSFWLFATVCLKICHTNIRLGSRTIADVMSTQLHTTDTELPIMVARYRAAVATQR